MRIVQQKLPIVQRLCRMGESIVIYSIICVII